MAIAALDQRMSFKLFVKGLGQKIQSILNRTLPPEQKLSLLLEEMEKDTQAKRVMARSIRARMVALADPETATLEPLERSKARKQKLVTLGATLLQEKETAETAGRLEDAQTKMTQLGQLTQEVKSLSASITSMESTYATLKGSYDVALDNYKVALAAYDHAKTNGPTLLFALRAHQEALALRDKSKSSSAIDASFINDLTEELSTAERELRSDEQIDKELDATNPEAHPLMAKLDREEADAAVLAEFRAAQNAPSQT